MGVALPVRTARQVHGTRVADVASGGPDVTADGLVSATRGLVVGIVTADCAPVLLVSRTRGVVAAVHAGWRGAAAGVLESAIEALRTTFAVDPSTIEAVIGPAVGRCCYEVGEEVYAAFAARTGTLTEAAWEMRGRWHLDLRAAVRALLVEGGVGAVATLGPCTVCDRSYRSFRRDGAGAGRQLSFIGWA